MNIEPIVVAMVGPATAAVGALLKSRPSAGPVRRQLSRDCQLLKELPADGRAHELMSAHIDALTEQLLHDESEKRADNSGTVLAIIFLIAGAALVVRGSSGGSWPWAWFVSAGVLLLFGAVGFSESRKHVVRDERGRDISRARRTRNKS